MDKDLNLAVLIDGDNVPSKYVKEMLEEIAKYGNPSIKRIYGDWTKPSLVKWKDVLLKNAITPIQQYGYTTGKNATDSAMIIDAMDILYSGKVNGFSLVSSDSDFTRLAIRLREAGMTVFVLRLYNTPSPFFLSFHFFIYLQFLLFLPLFPCCGSPPLFLPPCFSLRQRPRFFTAYFSLRQRPRFLYCLFLVAAAPLHFILPISCFGSPPAFYT